jgi:predicted ATP-dependent serine protease
LNYFCSSCGSKNNKWDLHCPNCESLSTIQWIKRSDLDKPDGLPQISSNNVLDKSLISY